MISQTKFVKKHGGYRNHSPKKYYRLSNLSILSNGMICNPGDLVGIPFPYSDLSHKERRPVLIITHPDQRGDFMCLAVTSVATVNEAISLDNNMVTSGNIPKTSWIRYDKIFTLNTSSVLKLYGALKEDVFQKAIRALCTFIGCTV